MTAKLTPPEALRAIDALGQGWHGAGTLTPAALAEIARAATADGFRHSLETGCGRSTLLLSHLSRRHVSFCLAGSRPGDSHTIVAESDLLYRESVEFVLGPTQRTVAAYQYDPAGYDFILLDGPHAYPFPDLEFFHLAPRLATGGTLAVDDIHIPTVHNLYRFLKADARFVKRTVAGNTAFFARTDAPAFPQDGDGWETQGYNRRHFPVVHRGNLRHVPGYVAGRVLPAGAVEWLKRRVGG